MNTQDDWYETYSFEEILVELNCNKFGLDMYYVIVNGI